MKNVFLAALLFALGCQSQTSATAEVQSIPLPESEPAPAEQIQAEPLSGGAGDAASLAPPVEVKEPVVASVGRDLNARPRACPPGPPPGCATCPKQKCVDGKWVDVPQAKTCAKPPPGGPCAGAIGFCPVWSCVDGKWVDQRPSRKGPGSPSDPLAPML
ncbi:MAG: hypothetical protein IPM79_17405 [Polyangiaceae bacterium]|jgi:hypothetical protein|nr:hypothetical protein [Polyangiaceae bacterium]MBK8939345.1 hypothetical protein [Polyangiaceae bacterium]